MCMPMLMLELNQDEHAKGKNSGICDVLGSTGLNRSHNMEAGLTCTAGGWYGG